MAVKGFSNQRGKVKIPSAARPSQVLFVIIQTQTDGSMNFQLLNQSNFLSPKHPSYSSVCNSFAAKHPPRVDHVTQLGSAYRES